MPVHNQPNALTMQGARSIKLPTIYTVMVNLTRDASFPAPLGHTQVDTEPWGQAAYVTTAAIMTLIGVTAFLGNGSILCMFLVNRALITPTNALIMALCLSDLLICICGLPLGAASNYSGRWLFGETGCIWYGFTNLFFGLASLNTLCGISVARFFTVVVQRADSTFNLRKAIWLIIIGWAWALIWAILPLTGWTKYTLEGARTSCSILWRSDDPKVLSYVICLFLFGFVLPTGLMVYCYICIYLAMKTKSSGSLLNSAAQRKIYNRQRRVLRLILALTIAYFITWLPYTVVAVICTVGNSEVLSRESVVVPSMFAKSSTVWNPVVYVLLNSRFRKAYIEMCRKIVVCETKTMELPTLEMKTLTTAENRYGVTNGSIHTA